MQSNKNNADDLIIERILILRFYSRNEFCQVNTLARASAL